LSEARVLASIDHPHIVPVYDYVEHDDACVLVMERLAGGTVWHRFVDRGFDQRTACAVALVACSGLHSAHQRGVLHRDMKPENMLFGEDGVLKVTDFGIARVMGEDDTLATRDGELLGTPHYMAPEQASGADLGPSTDVYAAGVMLYELLSGRLPYQEEGGSMAIVLRHINEDAVPLRDVAPGVPPGLAEVVMQALARTPEDRFASAEMFGVAVGEAAAASWGAGWLDGLDIALREAGPILESAKKTPADAMVGGSRRDAGSVRPVIDLHSGGGVASDLVLSDLMPLRRRPVEMPAFPTVLTWAAAVLAAVAVVLGMFAIGSSSASPRVATGSVTVAGHELSSDGRVPISLGRPIPIVVQNPPADDTPTSARLVLSLGGLPVAHSTLVPLVRRSSGLATTVDASSGRYIVGGKLSADLELVQSHGTVNDRFGVQVTRSPFATFGGVVGVVLLLIVAAYAESMLRSLRRGRRRDNRSNVAGLAIDGVLGGLTAALWGWMFGIASPSLISFAIPAIIGASAGLLAGFAALQVGKRERARRQSNRLVLVARRQVMPSTSEPARAKAQG
jgi:serine/threonine-protein kinase